MLPRWRLINSFPEVRSRRRQARLKIQTRVFLTYPRHAGLPPKKRRGLSNEEYRRSCDESAVDSCPLDGSTPFSTETLHRSAGVREREVKERQTVDSSLIPARFHVLQQASKRVCTGEPDWSWLRVTRPEGECLFNVCLTWANMSNSLPELIHSTKGYNTYNHPQ